jgi:bla regulator protein blaR1
MNMGTRLVMLMAGAFCSHAAQSDSAPATRVAIEVASIRPSDPASCKAYPIVDNHNDRYDMKCVKPRFLIQLAYNVRDFQTLGGPGWLASAQYDIAVKIESSPETSAPEKDIATRTDEERRTRGDRFRVVLQSLLADRFQLKAHRETKELPVFLLKTAKGGPKLKAGTLAPEISGGLNVGRGSLAGKQTAVSFLAQALSQIVARPIVDQTGLIGKYDFELKWSPDQSSPNSVIGEPLPPSPSASPNLPNIFTALQEQLGLKLESARGPVEVIVIDRVEKPGEN